MRERNPINEIKGEPKGKGTMGVGGRTTTIKQMDGQGPYDALKGQDEHLPSYAGVHNITDPLGPSERVKTQDTAAPGQNPIMGY